jgi:hypothetical protein
MHYLDVRKNTKDDWKSMEHESCLKKTSDSRLEDKKSSLKDPKVHCQ